MLAIIIVKGRLVWCIPDLEFIALTLDFYAKYTSKLLIASGIMSRKAIDMNRDPEKVIAYDIIFPYLKQLQDEMNLPKIITYRKKAAASTILIMKLVSKSIIGRIIIIISLVFK